MTRILLAAAAAAMLTAASCSMNSNASSTGNSGGSSSAAGTNLILTNTNQGGTNTTVTTNNGTNTAVLSITNPLPITLLITNVSSGITNWLISNRTEPTEIKTISNLSTNAGASNNLILSYTNAVTNYLIQAWTNSSINLSASIANLPALQVEMPASLDDPSLKLKLKLKSSGRNAMISSRTRAPGLFRAPGDTTNFDLTQLPDAKSQGWYDMKSKVNDDGNQNMVKMFMNILRNFASNHVIPVGEDVIVGLQNVPMGWTNMDMDLGKFKVQLANGTNTLIYWSFVFDMSKALPPDAGVMPSMPIGYQLYIEINGAVEGQRKIGMIARITNLGTNQNPMMGDVENQKVYGYFNEATTEVIDFSYSPSAQNTYYNINKSESDNAGGLIIYSAYASTYSGSVSSNVSIGWGNDSYGGVISINDYISSFNISTNTYFDNVGGSNITFISTNYPYTNSSMNSEYYDQNGSFVFRNYGDSGQNFASQYSWMNSYKYNSVNLSDFGYSTAPSTVSKQYTWSWDPTNYTSVNLYRVQKQDTSWSDWIVDTNWSWSIIWKPDMNSDMVSGDSVYWQDTYSYDTNTNGQYIYTYNYVKGYTVPTKVTVFDRSFYANNTWPIKYLTLEDQYSNFALTREVVNEYVYSYDWTNFDGTPHHEVWGWTNYNWWLDKAQDSLYDQTNDIRLQNIFDQDVWIWNNTSMQSIQQKTLTVNSTEAQPLYFNFTKQAIVDAVKSQIDTIYNQKKAFDLDAFLLSIPAFPNLTNFPAF